MAEPEDDASDGLRLVEAVGHEVLSTVELDELLWKIVTLVQSRFGLYYVVIALREGDVLYNRAACGAGLDEGELRRLCTTCPAQPLGAGLMGHAATTGEAALAADVELDPRHLPAPWLPETRSELAVPLVVAGEVVGVLDVQEDAPDAITEATARLVGALAPTVAIAIRNARLIDNALRRERQLRLVGDVGRIATSSPRAEDVLPRVAAAVREAFGFSAVVISLLDETGDHVVLTARSSAGEGLQVGHAQPIGVGVVGRVVATGEPMIVPDIGACEGVVALAPGLRSELCVPLRRGERVFGVLDLESDRLDAFDLADLELAQTLAEQVVGAIANARSYAQVQALDRWRSDLLAILVHDLRSPLTAAIASLDVLGAPGMGALDPRQRSHLAYASSSVGSLSEMIESILETYRFEEGSRPLSLAVTSVEALVARAVTTSRVLAEVHGLVVEATIEEDLPAVEVDPGLIVRVLTNLIGNAVKFAPPGSVVRVGARRGMASELVELSVEDEGRGIAEVDQARIFEKFAQVESRRAGRRHGIGLGLAFCREAVEAHGCEIRVDSAPGRGATFLFTVPVACRPFPSRPD